MTDRELIFEIRKGNQQAFRMFVEKNQLTVVKTCNGFIHNLNDAEDVAQEVFLEVYRSIHTFREEARLSTWLYRIAVNKSLNHLRKYKLKKNLESIESLFSTSTNMINEIRDNNTLPPDDRIEQNERAQILHKAIDSLSTNQRISFILNKYEDLSYKEIAEIMNTSLSAVESLIHRAKINLQKKLFNYYKKNYQ
jgi:RNA polymerase sigma-70 factor (ECF subfamily)